MSDSDVNLLIKYELAYWQTIEQAKQFLLAGILPEFLTSVQSVDIYRCSDGYLIFRFSGKREGHFVRECFRNNDLKTEFSSYKFHSQSGSAVPRSIPFGLGLNSNMTALHIAQPQLVINKKEVLTTDYLSATIIQGKPTVEFYDGKAAAERDVRTFVLAANLGVQQPLESKERVKETERDVIRKLEELLAAYSECLSKANREEDIQQFLNGRIILNPFAKVRPKYKLGKEYVCDFLLEDKTATDFRYVFVEIEPASADLFLKTEKRETEFTQAVHHALSQLTDWEVWARKNIAYLRNDFEDIDQPGFWLVMGRSAGLSNNQLNALRNESAGRANRKVMTYDDLAARLRALIESLKSLAS